MKSNLKNAFNLLWIIFKGEEIHAPTDKPFSFIKNIAHNMLYSGCMTLRTCMNNKAMKKSRTISKDNLKPLLFLYKKKSQLLLPFSTKTLVFLPWKPKEKQTLLFNFSKKQTLLPSSNVLSLFYEKNKN